MKARKHSLIHDYVEEGKAVFISFDIETGGDDCGIVQISAECFVLDSTTSNGWGERLPNTFDSYVKPPPSAIWSDHATLVHGIHQGHPFIVDADSLGLFWGKFKSYIDDNILIGHHGVLVAWNGETCDMG